MFVDLCADPDGIDQNFCIEKSRKNGNNNGGSMYTALCPLYSTCSFNV